MTAPFFVDTNVLFYADDARSGAKQGRARELVRRAFTERSGKLSVQVLQEFFAAATGKLGLSAAKARSRIEILSHLDVVKLVISKPFDVDEFTRAILALCEEGEHTT